MMKSKKPSLSIFEDRMYLLQGVSILIMMILTLISYLRLCSEECSEGHNYLLFGYHFEAFGAIFLTILTFTHIFQRQNELLRIIEPMLFAGALGAELMFIVIQKYYIGKWCPVCLGIAACIAIAFGSYIATFIKHLKTIKNNGKKGDFMRSFLKGISTSTALCAGFFIAFMGISKHDALQSAQDAIRENIAFGNKKSKIEVYLFTDWACPACKNLEPQLEGLTKAITQDHQLIFVDHVIHPETLNFIPYNLSFILNDKPEYLKLREMLTKVSDKTGAPSEQMIAAESAKLGVKYTELNYSDIALAIKYYRKLAEKFKISETPTLVIINTQTKKGKKLTGTAEITKENVMKSIKILQQL